MQIAIFGDFVEIVSRICCMRTLHAACQKFSLKYFREGLKIHEIREIKDPRKRMGKEEDIVYTVDWENFAFKIISQSRPSLRI